MTIRAVRASLAVAVALLLAGPVSAGVVEDVTNAEVLGMTAEKAGFATGYKLGNGTVDIFSNTNSTADARTIANGLCKVARDTMKFEEAFTVRVFLVVGDRPAATCKTSR